MRVTTRDQVLKAVLGATAAVTANDVASATGFDLITTSAAMSNLVADGLIVRTSTARPARYEVPNNARQLPAAGAFAAPGPHPAFGFVCGRAA